MKKSLFENWDTKPFETRLDLIYELMIEVKSVQPPIMKEQADIAYWLWVNSQIDNMVMNAPDAEQGSPYTFLPNEYNTKEIDLKIQLTLFAIETYHSSRRLLAANNQAERPNLEARRFLEQRHERAANFLDSLTFRTAQ